MPAVIQRKMLENPAWYTAYTPYQPEISQGRLEAMLEFQTMVWDLTGLPVANASMLDEATAAAEAMAMAAGARRKAARFFVDARRAPADARDVMRTRAEPLGIEVVVARPRRRRCRKAAASARWLQYPAPSGIGARLRAADRAPRTRRARWRCVAADSLALVLLEPPGELGADIGVGTSQRFGVPWASAGRTPPSCARATRRSSARCPAGSSACRSTPTAARRCASRCRRASSTSAARRRRPTSARRRCCSPSSRRCTPSTTGREGLERSRGACTG